MTNGDGPAAAAPPLRGSLVEHVAQRTWSSPQVAAAARFAATRMAAYEGSHGFDHALRVHGIALRLAGEVAEQGTVVDVAVVELAALLHDVFDHKLMAKATEAMAADEHGLTTGELLEKHLATTVGVASPAARAHVVRIATRISYSSQQRTPLTPGERSVELDVVQDADRLEAVGAVGVARAFAHGGAAGAPLAAARAHYDDKLARLPALMRTAAGAAAARARAERMRAFFDAYDAETRWAAGARPASG